ncbi:MAG: segregation/condensation protein A [Clostridia bacterium]|nr:segregation/condensation protein A [Clostridia bacterium]MBR2327623.1 segregation/condensation protein A [Clostridia bacterium]
MVLSYQIGDFAGPLDLLLTLIAKNKIDIFDIPISLVLEQYYEYIDKMKEEKLEVTAEFLAMAAELVYIKSRMMLPVPEDEEEGEDPRERLVRMLLEYKRYKEVMGDFARVSEGWVLSYTKQPDPPPAKIDYTFTHETEELSEAYLRLYMAQGRKAPPPVTSFKGIVGRQPVSVYSRVMAILRKLYGRAKMKFSELFSGARSRSEVVATFLAVLEMSKGNTVIVDGEGENCTVKLAKEKKSSRFKKSENGE